MKLRGRVSGNNTLHPLCPFLGLNAISMPFLFNSTPAPNTKRTPPASYLISEKEINRSRPLKVTHVAAKVSGIVGAIRFGKLVLDFEFVIYEKNPDVGGTWYENKHSGYTCGTHVRHVPH